MDWANASDDNEYEWTDEEEEFPDPGTNLCSGPVVASESSLPIDPDRSASPPSTSCAGMRKQEVLVGSSCSQSCEVGTSRPKLVSHFVGMGFPEDQVTRVIEENGEDDTGALLDILLTHAAIKTSLHESGYSSDNLSPFSTASEGGIVNDDFSDMDSFGDEEIAEDISEKDKKLLQLVEMGFPVDAASAAIERCGLCASFLELADSIHAAQIAEEFEDHVKYEVNINNKRVWCDGKRESGKRSHPRTKREYAKRAPMCKDETAAFSLPKPMVGFGLPTDPSRITQRKLPEGALGPPFFYYENVALAPKGVWETFSRFLYDIQPEFVDSKHFSAAARKRGYIHNLPIDDRFPLLPIPPMTIHEALPSTKKWWPSWDKRTKLNCLQTVIGTARLTERIRSALVNSGDPPPPHVQQFVLDECRKWNLVWVGLHKVAPLEPDEVEMLLGFPKNHTRGGGISRTVRYRSLGNSFHVDTVAYQLSVLKDLFPCGIRVLSLFSGIGGAEVALHRLGVPLNVVVSVEISEVNRNIVRGWWEQTEQRGTFIEIADVQEVNEERLKQLINKYGGFDLVIGGSPCNNLAGSNRVTRDGLEGEHSSLFYDYFRILDHVKCIMGKA